MARTSISVGLFLIFATSCRQAPRPSLSASTATPGLSTSAVTVTVTATPKRTYPPTLTPRPSPEFLLLPTPPLVAPLSGSDLQELVTLKETRGCEFPCWNGITPGQSRSQEIPTFFAHLGIEPFLDETPYVERLPDGRQSASAWAEITSGRSPTSIAAADLGLDDVGVFWDPVEGTVQAIWLDYWRPPPGFEAQSLFATMGRPDKAMIDSWGTEGGPIYTLLFTFLSKGALVAVEATPRQWPRLCFSGDDLQSGSGRVLDGPFITLVAPYGDPHVFADPIGYGYGPLFPEEPSAVTGLSEDEFLDMLTATEACVTLSE